MFGIGGMLGGVGSWLGGNLFGDDDGPVAAPQMTPSTWSPQKGEETIARMRAEGINPFSSQGMEYINAAIAGERENDPRFAEHFTKQIPGIGKQYYEPFINAGQQAQGLSSEQYNKMSANPKDYLDELVSGYKPSQGYQFREKRALDAARNSAAQGGLSGTYNDQHDQSQMVNDMMGGDIQQYLANVLGIQGGGLAGQERTIDRGFNASGNLANYLGNAMGNRAGLAYGRENTENQNALNYQNDQRDYAAAEKANNMQMLGSIFGGMGDMFGGGGGLGDIFGGGIKQTPPYIKPTRGNGQGGMGGTMGLTQPTSAYNPQKSIYGGFR